MGRYLLSAISVILAAIVLLATGVPAADASAQWCEEDPLVVIQTPGGSLVPLYVTNGALGAEHLPAVLAAGIGYTVKSVESGGATLVKVQVQVPDDLYGYQFETRSTVSTGPLKTGAIYATTQGFSSQVMQLEFKLQTP